MADDNSDELWLFFGWFAEGTHAIAVILVVAVIIYLKYKTGIAYNRWGRGEGSGTSFGNHAVVSVFIIVAMIFLLTKI